MLVGASQTGRIASFLVGGVFALSLAVICFLLVRYGPQLRAAAEAQRAEEIDQESKAFCRKLGIGPETARHAECARDLMEIRRRHEERMASDMIGVL